MLIQNSVTLSMARHNKENVLAGENVPEKEKGRRPSRELHHYHTQTQAAMQSASDSGKVVSSVLFLASS